MTTEEILADELLQRTEESDLSIDALLALLAYSCHNDTTILVDAREEGAQVGSVGSGAYLLRERAAQAIGPDNDD